jgi:phosphatidylinositol 3-kinase
LTKFVKSVAWSDPGEARQAVQILPKWTEIDVDDALELLGPSFDNPAVRAYAVERLRKADDDACFTKQTIRLRLTTYRNYSYTFCN